MARTDTLGHFLTDVADAIREKKGTEETITASDFDTEIANLPSGGDYNVKLDTDIKTSSNSGSSIPAYVENLPTINVSNIAGGNANYLFRGFEKITSLKVTGGENIVQAYYMFYTTRALKSLEIDLSNATNISYCFSYSGLADFSNVEFGRPQSADFLFASNTSLETAPYIDLSQITNFRNFFQDCSNLENVPAYNLSSVNNSMGFYYSFKGCYKLTNESLNNILAMCISATNYTGTKTLYYVFGSTNMSTYYPASTIQSLSNYQDFVDAGWIIGW